MFGLTKEEENETNDRILFFLFYRHTRNILVVKSSRGPLAITASPSEEVTLRERTSIHSRCGTRQNIDALRVVTLTIRCIMLKCT